jgi:single-stranded-DNA-specific exonuclease
MSLRKLYISLTKMEYRWIEPQLIGEKEAVSLSKFSPVVRQLLYTRGVRSCEEAEVFFSLSEKGIVDPSELFDVDSAVERIEQAISLREKIFIHGDFDADGLCATAILWEYLYKERKADALPYIPSRVDEGYGMTGKSLDAIVGQGGSLVISVDCGVRDGALISTYLHGSSPSKHSKKTLDFVVTDHHQLGESLPSGVPLVHPLHPDGSYENAYLSGAGVAWKLVAALVKRQHEGSFKWGDVRGIDLAGFATICDLMPLSGENRIIASMGLQNMNEHPRPGIRAMMLESGISSHALSSYDVGYILGPRINAAGRIGDPLDALRLLTTGKTDVAGSLARALGVLNRKRQEQTEALFSEVREQIEREGKGEHLYFAYGNDWNEGIIGLVAGKLQELYHRPVVLVTKGKEGVKGSARSINGFNIVEAIGKFQELLVRHGGHAQAAGFTIDEKHVGKFGKLLQEHAKEFITQDMLNKELRADAFVDAGQLDWNLMDALRKMEPFGYGNRRPLFWVQDAVVVESNKMGDGSHLKLLVKGNTGEALECVFFGGAKENASVRKGAVVDLIGNLDINTWNGVDRLQFRVLDMKIAQG